MALKDVWEDKIDGQDDVLAEDINMIAHSSIKNAEDIADRYTKQETENLIRNSTAGAAVNDVSGNPIETTYAKVDDVSVYVYQVVEEETKNKVDKEVGKGLSEENYTTEEKEKVSKIDDKADKGISLNDYGIEDAYTKKQADEKFQEKLTNEQFENINNISNKVDKVEGKYLSTNDYTNEEKQEVAKIVDKADISYVKNTFANALKRTASGEAVAITDVSPVEHTMAVKVASKNILNMPDVTAVNVKKYGANIFDSKLVINRTSQGLTTKVLEDGGISFKGTATANVRYSTPSGFAERIILPRGTYTAGENLTITVKDKTGKTTNTSKTFTLEESCLLHDVIFTGFVVGQSYDIVLYPCISVGDSAKNEPYKEPTTYTPNADGTVEGVTSIYPSTTLLTDAEGVIIDCEYNRDINKAFEELTNAIISLGGNV